MSLCVLECYEAEYKKERLRKTIEELQLLLCPRLRSLGTSCGNCGYGSSLYHFVYGVLWLCVIICDFSSKSSGIDLCRALFCTTSRRAEAHHEAICVTLCHAPNRCKPDQLVLRRRGREATSKRTNVAVRANSSPKGRRGSTLILRRRSINHLKCFRNTVNDSL